jgi:membrane peptidoglycan carboxypeptidase
MGIRDKLEPSLQTAVGGSPVTMFDHVQGFQVFANNGLKVPLTGVTRVLDRNGSAILGSNAREQAGQTQVLTPAEAYLMTYVLKDYQKTWNFPWNRQMASKTGTTGAGNQQPTDAWVMAYNPDIVIGSWVGHTGPNGQGGTISTYGEAVGNTLMASFVNGLPSTYSEWYRQPAGLVTAKGSGDPLLPGTESLPGCSGADAKPGHGGGGGGDGGGDGGGGD